MASNTSPIFGLTAFFAGSNSSAANTNRDGTGVLVPLFSTGTNTSRVDRINIKYTVTTTVGMFRIFIYDTVNNYLWHEIPVDAVTVAASTPGFEYEMRNMDGSALAWFPPNYTIKFTTHNAENVNASANGWHYT